jgi:hypothetical protein
MRALVVYESMYGNTHAIADHIAEGLRPDFEVTVVPVVDATGDLLAAADLVVVGGPTHAHGMSMTATREAAVKDASKPGHELELDPDAEGPGLRDWFDGVFHQSTMAAAFDTRFQASPMFTGRASKGIARRLRHHGFRLIVEPESFLVDKQNRLLVGEAERATAWARILVTTATATRAPTS